MAVRLVATLWGLIAFACSAGCDRNAGANYSARYPFAYVQRDCGPTDGEALKFYFTINESLLGKYREPFLLISIDEGVSSSAPKDYSIKPGKYALLGSRCLSPGKCDAASSGYLHVTTFTREGVTGKYELHFQDGRVEWDSFAARWYVVKQLTCG